MSRNTTASISAMVGLVDYVSMRIVQCCASSERDRWGEHQKKIVDHIQISKSLRTLVPRASTARGYLLRERNLIPNGHVLLK